MVLPFVDADQVIPSVEYINLFGELFDPPTTNILPFQATDRPTKPIRVLPFVEPDQVKPSVEYIILFVLS